MNFMIGLKILHYEILRELGAGAMGVVYEALDTKLERRVALKFLTKTLMVDAVAKERFALEAKIISKFDHPNIGSIYAFEEVNPHAFLVIAFYEGETLNHRLKREELSLETSVGFALEIAYALEHAHAKNVIHRDIKPANVFVARDLNGIERMKVLDFGLAKLENASLHLTKPGRMLGTVLYASPEQLRGQFSAQSDLWAFGCMFYEMLTRQPAFIEESVAAVMQRILNTEPIPLEQVRPDTPDDLVYLVTQCLQKKPEERIQSATEIIQILEQCLFDLRTKSDKTNFLARSTHEFKNIPTVSFPKPKLPVPTNQFVGRETEVERIIQSLQTPQTKLISIVGLGGMGKTWLSLEVAAQLQDSFRDGVAFVDLARLEDASLMPSAILDVLEIPISKDPLEDMLNALAFREMLIVLDNFEHLIAAKEVVAKILEIAPKVQLLVTTRESLGLRAEFVMDLNGFPEPDLNTPLEQQSAAKIFLQSAKRANSDFGFQASDYRAFKRIFKALSGSPLGLSLAGTWTRTLELVEIAEEIERELSILETDAPDLPTRQRGFAAVFNSSWQLLSLAEQEALVKMTVFRGGFNKDWAKKVTGANLHVLQSLVNKSLISRKNNRYTIHELIRQFAEHKLSGETHEQTMFALSQACLTLGKEFYDTYYEGHNAERTAWIEKLNDEHDNFRSVFAWAGKQKEHLKIGANLIEYLQTFLTFRGSYLEIQHWSNLFFDANKRRLHAIEMLKAQIQLPNRVGVIRRVLQIALMDYDLGHFESSFVLSAAGLSASVQLGMQEPLDHWSEHTANWHEHSGFMPDKIALLEQQGAAMTLEEAVSYAIQHQQEILERKTSPATNP
jgi:serine/threonine protein kinase